LTVSETAAHDGAGLLRTLANPQRLKILCLLASGELSVNHLQAQIALSQSALSQHLAKLRIQKLVATRRHSQKVYYRIVDEEALGLARSLLRLAAQRKRSTA
jgi:ArsR family transcriptional regulator, virulence genes transcriptional regulator